MKSFLLSIALVASLGCAGIPRTETNAAFEPLPVSREEFNAHKAFTIQKLIETAADPAKRHVVVPNKNRSVIMVAEVRRFFVAKLEEGGADHPCVHITLRVVVYKEGRVARRQKEDHFLCTVAAERGAPIHDNDWVPKELRHEK